MILHASLALPTYSALSSVYETVHVRSSVCPSRKPTAAGLLQWARRAGNINRLLQQQRAHAGSATLWACVHSWTDTFLQDVAIREMMGAPVVSSKYTVSQKTSTFYILNNCQQLTDFNDFWHVKSGENLTRKSYRLSTFPVRYSHWKSKKVIFNNIIHTYFWLFTLSHKKTICNPLATPPESVTSLTRELLNFYIWLEVSCILSNVAGSEESQLWVVIGGSEKNQLWCVATGMSGKQRHSKCLEWPPSALIHASSLFRHWSVA